MSMEAPIYVLDANVFIEAHRRYYAFDLCPAFWDGLLLHHQAGRIVSIDRVQAELLHGSDSLGTWVKESVPKSFFETTANQAVASAFSEMMQWVLNEGQFKTEAVNEFAMVADGWLAAYAKASSAILVTREEYRSDARKRVPLPNVCRQFQVPYVDTFAMLRALRARFVLDPR